MNDRDNERRLQLAAEDPVSTSVVASGGLKSKLDLAFAAPTLFVELPSKGKFYKPGNSLQGKETLEIKFMTAKEEDILTNQSYIQKGVVLDKLLQTLIVSNIDYNDLIIGDKNAIMIKYNPTSKKKIKTIPRLLT